MSNFLPLTAELHRYIVTNSVIEPDPIKKIRDATLRYPEARMLTMPDQAQFIFWISKLINAKKAIEIGVFTGYATAWIAHSLPEDGRLVACDVDAKWPQIGLPFWHELGVTDKIDLRINDACHTLDKLIADGEAGTFDLVFIDADKAQYDTYYEKALQLIRVGGVIIFDNLLWSGKVGDTANQDKTTQSLVKLTQKCHQDKRVYFSLLTLADGVGLALKKPS